MMNPAAAGDGGGDAAAWTATESYGDEEEVTTTGAKPCLVWVFRVINMILCVMMAATGAIGIKNMRYEFLGDLVPLYIIALAALWFCYEVNPIRPCPPITGLYKRNFGFFYNALGKALFIIFMGLLCFGVEAGSLGIITGLAVAIDGGLLILLFLKYPHMYPKD